MKTADDKKDEVRNNEKKVYFSSNDTLQSIGEYKGQRNCKVNVRYPGKNVRM